MDKLPKIPDQFSFVDMRNYIYSAMNSVELASVPDMFSSSSEHFHRILARQSGMPYLSEFRDLLSHCTRSGAVIGLLVSALAAYVVYQLYLHPLAKYPGPVLGRLTQWYDVYHAYAGDKHILFYHLHKRYGPVVRFSPNSVSVNDPAALKVIYAHGANVQKSVFYKCFRAAPQATSTLLATEKLQHARKRRIMGQAFSDVALRGFEQYVLGHVQDLVERIGNVVDRPDNQGKGWSGPFDMAEWCNWLVFDIMGDLVFGRSFGTLGKTPENRTGIFLLGRAARRNYTIAAMPSLLYTGLERYLPILRGLFLDRGQYLAFGKRQVMERTKEQSQAGADTSRKDIFSFLLHAKDPESGEGMPMPELWMEGNTLIVAGSDTSSTTLAATLYYLLHNPNTLAKLEAEIRSTFQSRDEMIMGPQMQTCHYLRACIDETMRLTPAVGGMLPREVLEGGLTIPSMNLSFPAGTDVGVPIYAIHHHNDYVVEPFTFDPERWLPTKIGQEPHPQDKDALHAVFNPFSVGNRACLGKPLVYMELCIAIARILWEFDMRLSDEQHVSNFITREIKTGKRQPREYQLQDWFMSRNEGPWANFKRRGL